MPSHRTIILAVLACFLVVSGQYPAYGQVGDNLQNLNDAIMRNAELLATARELVSETNSAKARTSLRIAAMLHEASIKNRDASKLLAAVRAATRAREVIFQTIALAKQDAKLEENAAKAIDRARNKLDRAYRLVDEMGANVQGPEVRLLEESRQQLFRSRDVMREHLYNAALRLAISSDQLSTRAITMLKRDFVDPEAVLRELDKTDRALERLGEHLNRADRGAALRMFGEAVDVQRKAREQFHASRYMLSVDLTRNARNIAMQALRLASASARPENVEQAIHLTDMLLEQAVERQSESDVVRNRIEQASKLQSQAKSEFSSGEYERALKSTLRARRILKDALGSLRSDLDIERVRAVLGETDAVLENLSEHLAGTAPGAPHDLLNRATSQQNKAWRNINDGKLRSSLAHTKLARNLARRALRMLTNDDK